MNVITGALHAVRGVFDLMPTRRRGGRRQRSRPGWPRCPSALRPVRAAPCCEAAAHGHVSARHQMLEVAKQCDTWVDADGDDFWPGPGRAGSRPAGPLPAALRADLERGAGRAARPPPTSPGSCATSWPRSAGRSRPVGRERYAAGLAVLPRRHRRPGRDLRLGLRRTGPDRGRDARGRRQDRARRLGRRRRRRPRRRPGPHDPRQGGVPGLDAGSWPTGPSPSCTVPTSTSPSRSGGSSAAWRRPRTAASTTPARARTSPARAGCGGRCRRASTRSPPGRR